MTKGSYFVYLFLSKEEQQNSFPCSKNENVSIFNFFIHCMQMLENYF